MSGEKLKDLLSATGLSNADLAIKLKVTPQALNSTFNSPDVKSGIIEKLCDVLDLPITFFYGGSSNTITNNAVLGDNNAVGNINSQVGASDAELVTKLLDEISALRRQNEKLMDKLLTN